jgi:hypothetical protein
MTRHDFLLDGPTSLADLLRIEDMRTMAKWSTSLPRPAERELRRHNSIVCFLETELSLGQREKDEGEREEEDD